MKLVYIAGPYRSKDPMQTERNIFAAKSMAVDIVNHHPGYFPVTPHLCTGGFEHCSNGSDKYFLDGTLELLIRSDAMVLLDNWIYSEGSRMEAGVAIELLIPIFSQSMVKMDEEQIISDIEDMDKEG